MFWVKYKLENEALKKKLAAKDQEIERLGGAVENRNTEIKRLSELISNTVTSSTFAFDFDAVRVFSIERMIRDNSPCTVIGYILQEEESKDGVVIFNEKVKEWYYYCNQEQHESLVKQFKEHGREE